MVAFIFLAPKNNPITQLTATSDGTAKDFVAALTSGQADEAYAMLTDKLKADYSENYWKKEFFPRFADYKEQPKRIADEDGKGPATQPSPYGEEVHARRFVYQFVFDNLPYDLEIIVVKTPNDTWKVNDVTGKFQAQQ